MILTVTRVICTGSRDIDDEAGRLFIDRTMDALFAEVKAHLHILVGDCPTGADQWVRNWATWRQSQQWTVSHEVFEAHWSEFMPRAAAGPARNKRMVEAGAQLCLAFHAPPPALNRGTSGCVRLARRAGIEVREYGRETQATPDYEQGTLPI